MNDYTVHESFRVILYIFYFLHAQYKHQDIFFTSQVHYSGA